MRIGQRSVLLVGFLGGVTMGCAGTPAAPPAAPPTGPPAAPPTGARTAPQASEAQTASNESGRSVRSLPLEPEVISKAAGTEAVQTEGVVRITWVRDDVPVQVDGVELDPAAGLGSWAAFKAMGADAAMVMGDTVVFQDEVDAAMDTAFAHGLDVTALHNHFFFDRPKVYFMHIGGQGEPGVLAAAVRAVWDAIRQVREARPAPADGFAGPSPERGELDVEALSRIVGHEVASKKPGVAKVSVPREGSMSGVVIGGPMGLSSWAAFSGSDGLVAMDGDFIMTADEVQRVLRELRSHDVHVVALHNHMIGERPDFYFTHFWGKGTADEMARAFRAALDAQQP